jgi:glycerol-1-phosphate dehydrogenase [NAD(P)+]
VTTLTMARLQESLLASDHPPEVHPTPVTREDLVAHFGPEVGDACWLELEQKSLTPATVEQFNARLAGNWAAIVADCEPLAVSSNQLRATLAAARAPIRPRSIAVDDAFYGSAVRHARELRNRYTFLDLAGDARVLDRWATA